MAGDTYTLEVLANVRRYAEGMAQIPGITEKQAASAGLKFQNQLFKAQNAAAKVAKGAAKDAGTAWDKASKQLGASGELSEKLAGGLGLISSEASLAVSAAGKLGKTLSVLVSPVGLVVGGLGALTLSAAGAAAAMVKAVFASDEALTSLRGFRSIGSDFYPRVPQSTLDSIERVNASTDALQSIWSKLVVTVGAQVAPALERVTNVVVGAALAVADLGKYFKIALAAAGAFAQIIGSQVAGALAAMLVPLDGQVQAFLALAEVAGVEVPDKVKGAAQTLRELTQRTVAAAGGMWDSALAGSQLSDILAQLESKGEAFVRTQVRVNRTLKDNGKAAEDAAKKLDEWYLNNFLAIERNRKAQEEAANAEIAAAKRVYDAKQALQESMTAANAALNEAQLTTFTQVSEALGTIASTAAEQAAKDGKSSSLELFRASQAVAILQATMAAYKAAAEASAWGAAIGGPIGAAVAGAATFAVIEGAAVAQIAAQSPPSFHTGGVVAAPGWAPDETPVRARRGEGFLTERGVRAAGGAAGLAAMNRGQRGPMGAVSVELRVTGRTAQRIVDVGGQQPTRTGNPKTGHRRG